MRANWNHLRAIAVTVAVWGPGGVWLACADPIEVSVERGKSIGVSAFAPGITFIEDSLEFGRNDRAAVESARRLITDGIPWVNCAFMAWGVSDPWPDPSQPAPTQWARMDAHMKTIAAVGAQPILTLCEAPWWMKGRLDKSGTTRLIPDERGEWISHVYAEGCTDYRGLKYPAGYESPDPYGSRILDNQLDRWLDLVEAAARRYMVPPYRIRHFQVWNELKGYFDPATNHWAYDDAPGDPSGWNARHGYTYMYNRVYERLKATARSMNIDPAMVKVGGPYPVMVSLGADAPAVRKSKVSGPWGAVEQRSLDVISYWLAHKAGGEFLLVDGSNTNKQGGDVADLFTSTEKFAAVNHWIKEQPGAATLPLWWAEWYVRLPRADAPTGAKSPDLENALGAYAAIQQIMSGAAVTLLWGGQTETAHPPLWTSTRSAGGGQPRPWYYTYRALGKYFGAGTALMAVTASSAEIAGLASADCLLLVNKSPAPVSARTERFTARLAPYEVRFVEPDTGEQKPGISPLLSPAPPTQATKL